MVKILRIRVSDFWSTDLVGALSIQTTLNNAIASVDHTRFTLQDVIVTPTVLHEHNNGKGNIVDLFYTLVFKQN